MRFLYRTLAILALAMAAGLTHSWFVPLATSFGDPTVERGERQLRERASQTAPDRAQGTSGATDAGADPDLGVEQTPVTGEAVDPPVEQAPETPAPPPADIDIATLGDFISVEEARAIWRAGNEEFTAFVAFLDARYADAYSTGHITGARRLLAHEFTDGAGSATVSWLMEQEPDYVVIYCEGGECDASKNLARQLERNAGFAREQLHVLEPGYPAWAEQYPELTTTGDEPGEP